MQDTKFKSKIDLSEYYNSDDILLLFKSFPELKTNISNEDSLLRPLIIDKFYFYQVILQKIKNYFEISQTFIISDCISIILKDLKAIINHNTSKSSNLPIINNRTNYKIRPKQNHFLEESQKKRILSSKSNGKKIKANSSFYDSQKGKNFFDINKIHLNFEPPKTKIVHFMNEFNPHSKQIIIKNNQKKSNLKKIKSIKDLNINSLNDNSNISSMTFDEKIRKTSYDRMKTDYSLRSKSNGINLQLKKTDLKDEKKDRVSPLKNSAFSLLSYDIKFNDSYKIENKDFNIFEFSTKVGKENVLPLIGNYIFTSYNFNKFINITKFRNWCEQISKGYNNSNYYHNSLHAADITHTCFIYFKVGLVDEKIGLDIKSKSALYLSCICHDYKHPGFNNNYLIETKHPLATKYNDISVLENMHISEAFRLMNSDNNCNILENLEPDEYKIFRKQMISCVLSTDMASHNNSINFLKKCLKDDYIKSNEDKQDYMNLLIHSADISNPTKKFDIYYQWAELIVEEFYTQGDKEKELNLKCSCDRNTVTLYKSQLGFIDYVITPFYNLYVKLFDKLEFLGDNIKENRKKIKEMEDKDNKSN